MTAFNGMESNLFLCCTYNLHSWTGEHNRVQPQQQYPLSSIRMKASLTAATYVQTMGWSTSSWYQMAIIVPQMNKRFIMPFLLTAPPTMMEPPSEQSCSDTFSGANLCWGHCHTCTRPSSSAAQIQFNTNILLV